MSAVDCNSRGLPRRVILRARGESLEFESVAAASRHIGVTQGAVASAALKGHRCQGYEVRYV